MAMQVEQSRTMFRLIWTDEQALKLNQYVSDILKDMKEDMDFEFVTDSLYEA